ncbi:ATP-binding cassette domain-containing protein [Geobacillus thermoleovorans]|uniref:sugar ABC transporter ATP-binding protein n=1 Tax=Geobacillus TaxID=129337 RepID=UPI00078C29DD|nr:MULTISPECIES: sugar ABC transporter ATP-binding protein [Geobacillus]AMV11072.1 D-ribose transporter ATP-binding protein [Geobacillus thermoleovorans]OQP12029.1 D-xylose ABC transporter ATP-binding protein [Geobacillus thermoleovorans]QNU21724.1 sugar ABC transporter ATP-binding protein [Geobacillus thermoleovorans]TRY44565.1 sugar ABC transporter ATP-binding protein [Geobacillus sp. LEMMJ02]UPT59563.1 ATP-binding cassette domain-containing protein [Geobacillus thermoleovorans]
MSNNYVLEMIDITKEFPGVKALDRVQLRVKRGTVHALMGENGAGKSTLMKILIGIYTPDQGKIMFDGEELKVSTIKQALDKGISMIHQELSPVPNMTVAENIFLGREPSYPFAGWVKMKELIKKTRQLFEQLEIDIDPNAKMMDLSIANMQMVEIAKAISYNSKLIIMDEPTSAITEKEVHHLFHIIRSLKKEGVSIIYITHKMDELEQITDEVTVLRDGKYIGTKPSHQISRDELIQMMVGRELNQIFHKPKIPIGEVALSVKGLTKKGKFHDVSFEVRKGEIVGFAGLMGSGRTEVLESVFGVAKPDAGDIYVHGKKVAIRSARDAIRYGMGLLTEDRKLTGLFLPLSVEDNMITVTVNQYTKAGFLQQRKIREDCQRLAEQLAIKTPSLQQLIKYLSGGNQQKALIARWLLHNPDILFLDEPTRGIDVGAKAEIYNLIFDLAKKGKAIVVVSSEMPEILGLSDRIIVMHEGRKTGELTREEATQERIMQLATGQLIEAKR